MKLKACVIPFVALSLWAVHSHSAKLCAQLSAGSGWDAGVFSVVDAAGVTIATTPFVASGSEGCTKEVDDGYYVIRFNGANKKLISYDGVYGCITSAFKFTGEGTVNVVFEEGNPPFNGNEFCKPY